MPLFNNSLDECRAALEFALEDGMSHRYRCASAPAIASAFILSCGGGSHRPGAMDSGSSAEFYNLVNPVLLTTVISRDTTKM